MTQPHEARRTRSSRRASAALLAITTLAACRDGTAPQATGGLVVETAPATVVASRDSGGSVTWGRFTVQVTLRNTTDAAIKLMGCGAAAEREVAQGQWQIAIERYCALSGGMDIELAPRSTITRSEQMSGALAGPGGPEILGHVLAGRYRLLYRYAPADLSGRAPEARSAPFDVVE